MKDFDRWNKRKKKIQRQSKNKNYKVRDIWWANLGVNVGREQDGANKNFRRPVLIVKGFSKSDCLIIPLTTSNKLNKYYICIGNVEGKSAKVIISQIKLLDTKRLTERIGVLTS
jgi:mRNA interferase MazF